MEVLLLVVVFCTLSPGNAQSGIKHDMIEVGIAEVPAVPTSNQGKTVNLPFLWLYYQLQDAQKKLKQCREQLSSKSNPDEPDPTHPDDPAPPPPKPPGQTTSTCADNNKFCADWAKKGQCQSNPGYMKLFCRKSCQLCEKPCQDLAIYCDYWAEIGECKNNNRYMKIN